jgi:Na+/H+ antiporter NhaD/arsenite permease-like protein
MAPAALWVLALNPPVLQVLFRGARAVGTLTAASAGPALSSRARVTLAVILASAVGYTLGGHLAWTAAGGFVALMLLHRRDTRQLWPHIDGSLLVFFAALFVVVEGFEQSGAPAALFARYPLWPASAGQGDYWHVAAIFLVGSNLVSNVPFILVVQDQLGSLPDPRLGWELLAMASTFAGNLTLLGSVANVIVAEAGRDVGGLPFWSYLRVGFPLAIATTALGTAWLLWLG